MADKITEKNAMLLLYEFEAVFAGLESDEERGQLLMAMYAYERRQEEPNFTGILKFAWNTHIKPKMDSMRENYKEKCERLRANANKRWQKNADVKNEDDNNAIAKDDMQKDAIAWDMDKDIDRDKDRDIYIPSNKQTTISLDKQPVDNSNAQPETKKQHQASLDGMDLYNLPGKDAFQIFRNEYPRHQGALREVQTAWVTAVASGAAPGDLVMAARKYALKCKEERTEEKYIKMPQNFIASGTWKQYMPRYLPSCPHCHGQGVYQGDNGMIMCDCDRRYG